MHICWQEISAALAVLSIFSAVGFRVGMGYLWNKLRRKDCSGCCVHGKSTFSGSAGISPYRRGEGAPVPAPQGAPK